MMSPNYALFYIIPQNPQNHWAFVPQLTQAVWSVPIVFTDERSKIETQNQNNFLKHFEQQLRKTSIKYVKKVWSKEQDQMLLEMRNQGAKWTQISEKIVSSNPQICKRRLQRIKQDKEKWPHQIEQEIKAICRLHDVKWEQKMQIIYSMFPEIRSYSKKMIKQRYLTYLQESIEVRPWTIEQDLLLIKQLQKGVKKWKIIAESIPGRTELQLKNRYYGCLRNIQNRVQDMLIKGKNNTENGASSFE